MTKKTVFVYGTLLTGYGNWGTYLKPAEGIPAELEGFGMVSLGGFPGILEEVGSTIQGELFEVSGYQLERLDGLEGVPFLYRREKITTKCGKEAFVYVYNRGFSIEVYKKRGNYIPSGCWRTWKTEEQDGKAKV